ncbi:MAG: acetylornithine transaminase [Dehalococcoidia bacterium]|nr:acetylornithine transaminase [Dehalococcoidia bacterium]NUQ54648.1 acetylornithine transaminase [Dehalococcoidia bacterium]RIL01710.1 MAG: acetylornithine transaminase [bacterium]
MTDWIAEERKYLFQNYGRQPVVLVRGEGTRAWDREGKEYLDFVGGLAVNALGHASPVVSEALAQQSRQLIHTSNLYYTTPMVELAKLLVENSCLDRAFFCNSGAEAVETAIKLARRWGLDTRGGAFEIIAMQDGFHGRTTGALAATGNARYREPFEPLAPGFAHVPWNDLDAIRAATGPRTVAVLLEPIQGEGGVNVPAPGFLQGVRDWCTRNNLLLILDEVQTGIGRTGTLWAYQQEGIEPDIMCVAKALSGGVPIGAVLAREEIAAHLVPGDHGSTFGANPLAAAAGVATLRHILDHGLPARAARASERLVARLRSLEDRLPVVTEVRGRGLLLAVAFSRDIAAEVVSACRERGLLANGVRPNAIRLMPPLTVTDDEIDRACDILEQAIAAVTGVPG